jgi:uncharacterized protein YceK
MMMRRTSLMLVLVVALAGCSSGSSDKASSSKSTSPKAAATSASPKASATKTTPKPSPTSVKLVVIKVTDFCSAFKQLRNVKAANGAKVAGAAYQKAADDMRKYAPAAIKNEANAYANVIESSGKALTAGGMPTAISAKPTDLAKVTVWVSKNCKK